MPPNGTGRAATTPPRNARSPGDRAAFVATLRNNAWWMVVAAILAAGVTYLLQRNAASVYRAETTVLITKTEPPGLAADGPRFMAPRLSAETYASLLESGVITAGSEAAAAGEEQVIVEVAIEDAQTSAILRIAVQASTPSAAQRRGNAAAQALIAWDLERAQQEIATRAETLERQVTALEGELQQAQSQGVGAAQLGALLEARRQDLQGLRATAEAAATPLSIVREAQRPRRPVAPRPTRNAILAGLLAGMASLGVLLAVRAVQRP